MRTIFKNFLVLRLLLQIDFKVVTGCDGVNTIVFGVTHTLYLNKSRGSQVVCH
ncbi:unnamed protein product [Paramecium primaurelia]|uniref:Uncharacterized protein n=1 Tax=Paramecium primaurelia TaxID=5886 RepID=A0A8S1P5R4_PARPR|nr:unnamed protein product [Paramecium primaurelia]